MGTKRSFDNYMTMVGLNTLTKEVRVNKWCRDGEWPEQVRTRVYVCFTRTVTSFVTVVHWVTYYDPNCAKIYYASYAFLER